VIYPSTGVSDDTLDEVDESYCAVCSGPCQGH